MNLIIYFNICYYFLDFIRGQLMVFLQFLHLYHKINQLILNMLSVLIRELKNLMNDQIL